MRVPPDVCRLLGNLLKLRCDCDVRIDGDMQYNVSHQTTNSDSEDDVCCGPSAVVIIHPTPPPLDDVALEDWLVKLDCETTWSEPASAAWIGMEQYLDDDERKMVAIYHVFFVPHFDTLRLATKRAV
jgi:hypothetical protein